jgi:hypothetical protein
MLAREFVEAGTDTQRADALLTLATLGQHEAALDALHAPVRFPDLLLVRGRSGEWVNLLAGIAARYPAMLPLIIALNGPAGGDPAAMFTEAPHVPQ